ncbi:hypothetical protein R3P38DRAFT_3179752 [Favolaschia claudopus]|uniref:Uncharacterized protein n=1 Tax=Favolaschia claudopus TaxID=2862362 RepID=A0AAW0CQ28_9AGAR
MPITSRVGSPKNEGWVIPPIPNSLSIARPDNCDTVPGAAGVLDGTHNQGLDVDKRRLELKIGLQGSTGPMASVPSGIA